SAGRVLLLARTFPPPGGGAERRYAALCAAFPPGAVEVCAPRRAGHEVFDRTQGYPIHRVAVPPLREKNPAGFARWTSWTLRRAADGGVGVVWSGDLWPQGRMAWLARRLRGVPYGFSFYGYDVTAPLARPARRGAKAALERRVLDGAAFFYANSAHIAALAEEMLARAGAAPAGPRMHVIRTGADLVRFRPGLDPAAERTRLGLPAGPVVLTAARLVPEKNVAAGIRAFAQAARERPGASYVVAGAGRDEGALRTLAAELGVAGRVRFLGTVPHEAMPGLHAAADVFLLPSRRTPTWAENFPNAALEAMAAGRPVVAGDVGGLPEIVAEGETGFLVDPEDPAALAAALARLLADPALARRMGEAARARAEREFDLRRTARAFYRVLQSVSSRPLPPWIEEAPRVDADAIVRR
ncbi:MAG TPA: glycosyltransferase family 4 protein, partial [Gemmatimonadota bacterium]